VLYVSYDGILEPLGQSQVLSYVVRLADSRPIALVTFEKEAGLRDKASLSVVQSSLDEAGIAWYPLRYHKFPNVLATAWDIGRGICVCMWFMASRRVSVVHARSYVASVIALVLKFFCRAKFLFDMRGFWADERVDGGLWKSDVFVYRLAKWFERQFLRHADHVVSLTHAGIAELQGLKQAGSLLPPFSVIPTCADLQRFTPAQKICSERVIGYVGTVGTWYLFEPVAYCFSQLAKFDPLIRFQVVNRGEHGYIQHCLEAAGVPMDRVTLTGASFAEMPKIIGQMSASIFFIKQVFSKKASAPTKLAELLGCGVPCLTNTGVGDMAEQLAEQQCGITVSSFDSASLDAGVKALLDLIEQPDIALRCRQTAERHFELEEGVKRYAAVYDSLCVSRGQP
jgi:glycosyltransferase involved in cell wall biosynthesis